MLALVLTGVTNLLLRVPPFMMAVSLAAIFGLTLAIAAMALGFGAVYPRFETENAAQIPTSFGGLVFMMATIVLLVAVIVVLSGPVSAYLNSLYTGRPIRINARIVGAFVVAAGICAAATIIPLRIGLARVERYEF